MHSCAISWTMNHNAELKAWNIFYKRRLKPVRGLNKCYQKLHICIIYYISSHFIIKFTLFYCFLFVINWNTTFLQTGRQEAFFPKSVVWNTRKDLLCANVVLPFKPKPQWQESPVITQLMHAQIRRMWVKTTSCCPLPLSNYTKVKAQYKPFSI